MRPFPRSTCRTRRPGKLKDLGHSKVLLTIQVGDRDILLPHHSEDVAQVALDIGGSLAKVVWFSKKDGTPGGRLNFKKFETVHVQRCLDFIRDVLYEDHHAAIPPSKRAIVATGGGAHKFFNLFKEQLGIEMQKEDEMEWYVSFGRLRARV